MKTIEFFTKEFYEDPYLTVTILNELIEANQVADQEMYQSGTFLFMEVFNNERTQRILSKVISDLDAYREYNNQYFVSSQDSEIIGLCALQDEHRRLFGNQ